MISVLLYILFRMKTYRGFIYRIDKDRNLLIARNPICCALGLCSPSGVMLYYDEIKKEIKYAN